MSVKNPDTAQDMGSTRPGTDMHPARDRPRYRSAVVDVSTNHRASVTLKVTL